MENIILRSSGYYFRLAIPPDLKDLFGISEIKRTLKTGSLSLAKERASLLSGRVKLLFRKLRMKPLKREDINDIVTQYIEEALENNEELLLPKCPLSIESTRKRIEGAEDVRSMAHEDLVTFNYNAVSGSADRYLAQRDIEPDRDGHEYHKLCHELLKAGVGLQDVALARAKGDYSFKFPYEERGLQHLQAAEPQTPAITTPVPVAVEKAAVPTGPSIGSLKTKWFLENEKANAWKPRSLTAYTGYFTIFFQILGEDTPIDSIDYATVRRLKEALMDLPSGMNKKGIFKDKSVPEILEINKTARHDTLSVSTINGYITALGSFFKWCIGQGYMTTNYADGQKIKESKQKRPDQIRSAFTPEDLIAIFGSQQYRQDTFKYSYQFWLPVIGLYTGARLNELAQLRLADIQEVEGIPSLIFQEDAKDSAVSIKNMASMRTVPLHPFIANDLNFMNHVQAMRSRGEIRLFPELPYHNDNYGHEASKWFGRYKRDQGIESKQKVFHSFRHTLSDHLKQQLITETIIDELTGHAVKGETMGRYGKRYSVEILYKEAVLKLDYKVSLEHLKNSKWCR